MIQFEVFGIPQTKGSARAFAFRRKNGKLGVSVQNDNPKTEAWAGMIAAVGQQYKPPQPFEGPIHLVVVFNLPKPKWVTQKEKRHGPQWHTKKPDLDKVLRALKDALKGVFYRDDSQVVCTSVRKVYADAPGVVVSLREVDRVVMPHLLQEEHI